MDAIELLSTRASHAKLGEPAPDDATLDAILEAALRAPDHALLRPWRVLVVRGEARARLGDVLAETAAAREPDASEDKIERARRKPLRAPLLLVVAATPTEHPKAPEIEQVLSAGAVAHGILLGLHARGFAGMWRTGAPAYDPKVKEALGLRPEDHIVGFLYAGTATQDPPPIERPEPSAHAERWTGA
ncbi:MAG TPA: nitroreductase [Sandaracinaceae bacterium LLY-WYZ-13_1]|nr:nitroreductase [Sandaracinaceae bacterium LLY-WYZ-13_1]